MAPKTKFLRRRSTTRMGQLKTVAFLGLNVGGAMDRSLEKEITDEMEEEVPVGRCNWLRHRVGHVIHSKVTLLIIVVLCVLDCALVIGGLIIELKVMKDMQVSLDQRAKRSVSTANHNNGSDAGHGDVWTKVAHSLHYASVAILAVLLAETIIKIIFLGRAILKKKFEMFDALVVTVSFILDLVYIEGTTTDSIIDNAEALSIMLPWRVVRVVNSMVIALLSHEHIKLLLVYKSKSLLAKQLQDLTEDLDIIRQQITGVKELAINEGIADWKINRVVAGIFKESKQRKDALKYMVSMAMSAAISHNRDTLKSTFMSIKRTFSRKKTLSTRSKANHPAVVGGLTSGDGKQGGNIDRSKSESLAHHPAVTGDTPSRSKSTSYIPKLALYYRGLNVDGECRYPEPRRFDPQCSVVMETEESGTGCDKPRASPRLDDSAVGRRDGVDESGMNSRVGDSIDITPVPVHRIGSEPRQDASGGKAECGSDNDRRDCNGMTNLGYIPDESKLDRPISNGELSTSESGVSDVNCAFDVDETVNALAENDESCFNGTYL